MTSARRPAVLMVGCGHMGGAIASALVAEYPVMAFDPQANLPEGVERVEALNASALPDDMIIIIAVKPQAFDGMAPDLKAMARPGRLFLSIMAGIALPRLEAALGAGASIVRSMPNMPASIGHGMTAAMASSVVSAEEREHVAHIIGKTGQLIWIRNEADMDAITALSGSGPAFFYRFAEALIHAGVEAGLSETVSAQLVRQTFVGAARLAETRPTSLEHLREQVTSPGGTTAAGLDAMTADAAVDILAQHVVDAAARRSRELAA